jgi:hypothetical protein
MSAAITTILDLTATILVDFTIVCLLLPAFSLAVFMFIDIVEQGSMYADRGAEWGRDQARILVEKITTAAWKNSIASMGGRLRPLSYRLPAAMSDACGDREILGTR